MSPIRKFPEQNKFTLAFTDEKLESTFRASYDKSVKVPLRQGIIISILSWFSSIPLIYFIIPEKFSWLAPLLIIYIGSYFGFIVYATYKRKFRGYYHLLGAISNAWAGLFAVYYCDQFPNGENLTLPVLIFIIFFGSYMVRLRWFEGFLAALTYTAAYTIYISFEDDLSWAQVALYGFVAWMTLVFAVIAGRVNEVNNRIAYIQKKIIAEQNTLIEKEKQLLLQEVHHRVKNNLQIIISLINLELTKEGNIRAIEALKNTQSRVMSMSLVHKRMNQTEDFSKISLTEFTRALIASVEQNYGGTDYSFDLNIPKEATVDIDTAITLGIIFNEVISNFFKHCGPEKRFAIEITKPGFKEFTIKYNDNGTGFPDGTELETGDRLGLELIQILTEQIDGDFKFYNEDGAVYEIYFKLP